MHAQYCLLTDLISDPYIEIVQYGFIQCDLDLYPSDCHIRALADPHTFLSLNCVDRTTHLMSQSCVDDQIYSASVKQHGDILVVDLAHEFRLF